MKNSISKRLMGNFVLIIVLTVLFLELALLRGIKHYLYQNVEDLLTSKIEITTDFYQRYFSSYSLEDLLVDDVDVLWRQVDSQVQILNLNKEIIMDSIGYFSSTPVNTPDVTKAILGEEGSWVGFAEYSKDRLMAVSRPLYSDGKIIGIIRVIGSLQETDADLRRMGWVFAWVGVFVMGLALFFERLLAKTIVDPIRSLTAVAELMGDLRLQVRSDINQSDEIGKLAHTLNLMADEILKREQIKNDFITSVSHELRTPLTSIKGWAITLESCGEGEEELISEGLGIIEHEADRLTKMVEELLDFSRFISGRIALEKKEFSLEYLL
ncbi:MAG: HAMP domain-containing histidine kinase [Tissierellia bacterium]|nr:HAMP domain-containing histidine kinase [Tissierellia bacterium]